MNEFIVIQDNNFEDITNKIVDILTDDYRDFNTIAFVGKYDDVKCFLSTFVYMFKTNIEHIELFDNDIFNYKDEYLVSITNYDEISIYCEKFKVESSNQYKFSDAEIVFVMENCNSKALKNFGCDDDHIFVCIHDDFECIEEMQNNTDGLGITYSWTNEKGYHSINVYSDDKVWLDDIRNKLINGDI